MDVRARFSTEVSAETDGVWMKFGPKARVKVAKAGNRNYARLLRRKLDEAQIDISVDDDVTAEALREILVLVEAETIFLGFDGFTEDGEDVSYSKEKAAEYLMLPDFRESILERSRNYQNFLRTRIEKQGNGFALTSTGV